MCPHGGEIQCAEREDFGMPGLGETGAPNLPRLPDADGEPLRLLVDRNELHLLRRVLAENLGLVGRFVAGADAVHIPENAIGLHLDAAVKISSL